MSHISSKLPLYLRFALDEGGAFFKEYSAQNVNTARPET